VSFQFRPGETIRLIWSARGHQLGAIGEVRTVGPDAFQFDEVTNPGEVYSNYSLAPVCKTHGSSTSRTLAATECAMTFRISKP